MTPGQTPLPVAPLAVWALILGAASLVFCCLPAAIPAIICGHLARARIERTPEGSSGRGMALAGLIMGYVSIAMFILVCILGIIAAITLPKVIQAFS